MLIEMVQVDDGQQYGAESPGAVLPLQKDGKITDTTGTSIIYNILDKAVHTPGGLTCGGAETDRLAGYLSAG
jgi:hypothetical protein